MLSKYIKITLTLTILYLSLTNLTYAQTWTQLLPAGSTPTSRFGHSALYDAANNRMMIFGGSDNMSIDEYGYLKDTWVLSDANGLGVTPTWTHITQTSSALTSRIYHSAVYDSTNNCMIVFGGGDEAGWINDVWVLSNANGLGGTPAWTQLFPAGSSSPLARSNHTAVLDSAHNRMIIFGGFQGTANFSDTWVLSNANGLDTTTSTWTHLFPTGNYPAARFGHTAVYDSANNRMTIFGGYNSSLYMNDIWVLSNANGLDSTTSTWTQLLPTGNSPTTRWGHSTVYDTTNNIMTIFGGYNLQFSYPNDYMNDTWVLTHANGLGGTPTWSQVFSLDSAPPIRYSHTGIYDNTNNRMTIFGGVGQAFYNDIWVLSTANGLGIPVAGFYGSPTSGIGPLNVNFIDTTENIPTSWNWSFGDGSTSNIQNPSHIYATVATATSYSVQLIVTNSFGTSTSTQANYIQINPPATVSDWMLYSWETKKIIDSISVIDNSSVRKPSD